MIAAYNMKNSTGFIILSLLLGGCASNAIPPAPQIVKVPLPVVCAEEIPTRPVMPTEQLVPPVMVDTFVAAAIAEIERREGYEALLLSALTSCTTPLNVPLDKP